MRSRRPSPLIPRPFLPQGEKGSTRRSRAMPAHDGSMHRLPPYLVELCRTMRREPAEPEAWLWACLRGRRLAGAKFRRQRPLGRYIADFCCEEAKLVVELDGGVHASQDEYDSLRD